jgi:hypothetical protein
MKLSSAFPLPKTYVKPLAHIMRMPMCFGMSLCYAVYIVRRLSHE